jgi:polyisoprenoid-binding protein YceI
MTRRARWLIGAVAVVVVLVVGGPFVYFHFIEGKAPAPLKLSSSPTTVAPVSSGGDGSVTGTWHIASGSVVGYRVKETLFGQSNTAVGRTSAVTGSLTVSGTQVSAASFSVDMTQVTSDEGGRDSQFRHRIMDTSQFPTATFTLTNPIALGSLPADGSTVNATATGNLTLHGTTKSVTFPVHARRTGGSAQVSGSMPITFSDYNIDNPSGGPASVGNAGTLEFLLDLTHT